MRATTFYLLVLFSLHTQFATASEGPHAAQIGMVIFAAGAITVYTAYSWCNNKKNEELQKKHEERIARLKAAQAAKAEESSDDEGIGSFLYVK